MYFTLKKNKNKKKVDFSIFSDKERIQIVKNITDVKKHILLSVLKCTLSDSSIDLFLFQVFLFCWIFLHF